MIKTKPATNNYRTNFDLIFKRKGDTQVNKFRVPIDFFIYAKDARDAEQKSLEFMQQAIRDLGPTYNVTDAEFPVDFPAEPE